MPIIDANGVKLNYVLDGPDGAPVVMFSNSLAASTAMWDDQAATLKGDYRVLRYDNRGHGKSQAVPGPYDFDMFQNDIIAILDGLGIDKVELFCGLSLGGAMAAGMGAKHADRVNKVMVCDIRDSMPPPAQEMWQQRLAAVEEHGIAGIVEMTLANWFTPQTLENGGPMLDKVRAMIEETSPLGYAGCFGILGPLNLLAFAGDISVPALFVRGENDNGAPRDSMQPMQRAVPGADLIEIPHAAHVANMEQPQAFDKILLNFLKA